MGARPCSVSTAFASSVTGVRRHSPWRMRSAPPERPCVMTLSPRSPLAPPAAELLMPPRGRRQSPSVTSSHHHIITPSVAAAGIYGIGAYVPKTVLSNADLEALVETSDEWIVSRTGISERRVVAPGQATSDLATEAARRALDHA